MSNQSSDNDFNASDNNADFSADKTNTKMRKMMFVAAIWVAALMGVVTLKIATGTSVVKLPTLAQHKSGVEIFDRYDKLVTVVQKDGDRQPVALSAISPFMRQAVIGIEDHSFYEHAGVDPIGIARAMLRNAQAGHFVQGGSTLTQQLMKTMYFGPDDRTARRKILELFMALDVETCYSKDKILETYLNEVYYGRGAYGIQRAASTYFSKPASKLNLAESAYLAALVKAPSDLGQASALKRASARQRDVLDGMVECGFITRAQAASAKTAKLAFKAGPHSRQHPYYVNHVIALLTEELGKERLFEKPIKVYTNLDLPAQKAAELSLGKGIKGAPRGIDQGAVVSIDLDSGGIIALVGGVGRFERNEFNRAMNPHTAGSAFKPFVYLAGLMSGVIGPDTVLNDAPIAVPLYDGSSYSPNNYDGTFKGLMTVRDAIAMSRNVCAVQVAQSAGVKMVVEVAQKAGISSNMDPTPALALGTCAISPLEMANAYATLARGGEYLEPMFIRHINEKDGSVIKEYKPKSGSRLPAESVYQLVDCMEDVVKVGTGKRASLPGVAVAGKTGTADDSKDVWFVGFTPDVVTAVWAGNDANDAPRAKGITGGTIAAGIWSGYMNGFYKTHPKPSVAFIDPQQPLAHHAPYFAYASQDGMDDIEVDSDYPEQIPYVREYGTVRDASNRHDSHPPFLGSGEVIIADKANQKAVQLASDKEQSKKKRKHGGFFHKISEGIRKIF
ncbi:MAG: PBP1A family penicillin-binding protein [Candidatus Melainabacteria bacterium]|nr:PBP1A family penicillin-binding protein [Candidatus Melainabacteria bacterium]